MFQVQIVLYSHQQLANYPGSLSIGVRQRWPGWLARCVLGQLIAIYPLGVEANRTELLRILDIDAAAREHLARTLSALPKDLCSI